MRERSGIVTLTTDFGHADPYVAALEAALLQTNWDVRVVHNSHEVAPGDIATGAYLLEYAARSFPPGTVHLAVVDPGVGSSRPIIAIETEAFVLVGPDNNLLERALRGMAARAVELESGMEAAPTFESRDVMAPAAARLAGGADLVALGSAMERGSYELAPVLGLDTRLTSVCHVDRFGSLVLDLRHPGAWPEGKQWLDVNGKRARLGRTFSDVAPGELVAYRGSIGYVEVAARNSSAAQVIGSATGDAVEVALS